MYNPLTTFLQQVGLYAIEIGYKVTHPRCWERNLKKIPAYCEDENDEEEDSETDGSLEDIVEENDKEEYWWER